MSSLSLTLLLDAGLKATLVLGLAGLAALALRRSSAAARHLVWTLGLAGALTLPALSALVPTWKLPLLPAAEWLLPAPEPASEPEARRADPARTRSVVPTAEPAVERPLAAPSAAAAAPLRSSPLPTPDPRTLLWQLWLAGVLLVLAPLAAGTARMLWTSRRSAPLDSASWSVLAGEIAVALDLTRPVRLLRGGWRAMPMAWGVLRPAIVLPEDCEEWGDERRRAVLTHELAHVKRLDCLTQALAHVACALYWFHPLAWLAARRLRIERERACDDLVLGVGASGPDYADQLLQLARGLRASRQPALATVSMARPSQLEGRLLAILDPGLDRRAPSRPAAAATATLAAGLLVPIAGLEPWFPPAFGTRTEVTGTVAHESATPAVRLEPQPPAQPPQPRQAAATTQAEAEDDAEAPSEAEDEAQEPAPSTSHKETVVKALTGALSDSDAEVRREAAFALGQLRATGASRALGAALSDADREVRQQAAFALGQLRNEGSVKALVAALEDADAEVRQQAVFALGQIRSPNSAQALAAALGDQNAEVRQQAAFALGQLRDPGSVAALAAALRDSDADVRQQAVFALGQIRSGDAAPALAGALKDGDGDVRQQAAFALGQLRNREAVPALIDALKDKSPDVRQQAAFALGQLGDERALSAVTAALKDPDGDVRKQAAFALGQLTR